MAPQEPSQRKRYSRKIPELKRGGKDMRLFLWGDRETEVLTGDEGVIWWANLISEYQRCRMYGKWCQLTHNPTDWTSNMVTDR